VPVHHVLLVGVLGDQLPDPAGDADLAIGWAFPGYVHSGSSHACLLRMVATRHLVVKLYF